MNPHEALIRQLHSALIEKQGATLTFEFKSAGEAYSALCNLLEEGRAIKATDYAREAVKSGERKERTEWHNVVVWPKWAVEVCERLKKGDTVLIEGKLSTRSWEDNSGQKRWTTEVVLSGFDAVLDKIDRPPSGNRAPGPNSRDDYGTQGPASAERSEKLKGGTETGHKPGGFSRDLDDEIPF